MFHMQNRHVQISFMYGFNASFSIFNLQNACTASDHILNSPKARLKRLIHDAEIGF